MPISPQTQSVLARLQAGETLQSGAVSLGPLDEPTALLLRVLLDNQRDLEQRKGADQAEALCRFVVMARQTGADQAAALTEGPAGNADRGVASVHNARDESSAPSASRACSPQSHWRLWNVVCQSIRGVAPAGEVLEFAFDGKSTLIFGSNGSGKSSLLGAIMWVLTGRVILDTEQHVESAPIYRVPSSADKGAKICDWPVVATLPIDSEPNGANTACMAELELHSEDRHVLWIRRTLAGRVETSRDRSSWTVCASLAEWGIDPLDLQLSLLAPTVFGRQTVEQSPDTRSLLSLMLGYDDLEALGELASKLARNRTVRANAEGEELRGAKRDLQEKLAGLPSMLAEGSPRREDLKALSLRGCPAGPEIAETGRRIADDIEAADASLSELLGLARGDEGPSAGLGDRLTNAITSLEKGVRQNFPSLEKLSLQCAIPEIQGKKGEERLADTEAAFQRFIEVARGRIVRRLAWWRKEAAPDSKLALRLRAAQDYDLTKAECPVCEQRIDHLPIKDELATLKKLEPELQRALSDFFRDLNHELEGVVPRSLSVLAELTPGERITGDWTALCENTAGAILAPITNQFDERVRAIASGISLPEREAVSVMPDDAEEEFREIGRDFVEHTTKARKSLAVLAWSSQCLVDVKDALDGVVTASVQPPGESLLTALSKGKQAANDAKPLANVRDQLRRVYKDREAIQRKADQIDVLETLKSPLDQLKLLSKYAAEEVAQIFGSIKDKTIDNWNKLYPEHSSGLAPARLRMSTGRDKTIESLLGGGHCEVPGRFFANAGLQRAIALSFFFALLEQHPRGLGFIVMDDPILSLDEDHRESWSANVLRPWMDRAQVILATHQRQYLNNRRHDFDTGKVVELNPRSRPGRVTWRPGDRLQRAADELGRAPTNAPLELRKYREELLITLDAYSPQPFFDPGNLAESLQRYMGFTPPHPLAGSAQHKLAERLKQPEVTHVLDPGSHAMTEADVTAPMIRECLRRLQKCDKTFREELARLERLRAHALRRSSIPASAISFHGVTPEVSWTAPVRLRLLGRAAARPDALTIIAEDRATISEVPAGCAVLVAADSLDPVARLGQWVLLAAEDVPVADGDLAAGWTEGGGRLLRRVWSDGDAWVLQSINPVRPMPSFTVRKLDAALRKVMGVLYEPLKLPTPSHSTSPDEWHPRADFDPNILGSLRSIAVEGQSLNPIARRGQLVLVGAMQTSRDTTIERGGLAVIETTDEALGCVIKRVFPGSDQWILVSSNPVDPHDPIVVPVSQITAVWPLRGVLFESRDADVG